MHRIVSLTVTESKRLIAKGIAMDERVRRAFDDGIVAVAPGTTNAYVVEELLGEPIEKPRYVTGHTLPSGYSGQRPEKSLSDFVFKKGGVAEITLEDAVAEMGPGDVILKGANALNYDLGQAGLLIGHPKGGTLASVLGIAMARRVHLIHPAGLEKSIPGDLCEAALLQKEIDGKGPTLWPSPGEPFTEIEALGVLAQCLAVPVAAGGIGGAEGAVWLMLTGETGPVQKAVDIIEEIKGESPFLPRAG